MTPPIAITSGSDMTSLTPRETLGVFLQGRAGYWSAHNQFAKAEADLLLATACFPKNRDIRIFLMQVMSHTDRDSFTNLEVDDLAATLSGGRATMRDKSLAHGPRRPTIDVDRINRENARLGQLPSRPLGTRVPPGAPGSP